MLEGLVAKVKYVPVIGGKARACLEDVRKIRLAANDYLAKAVQPIVEVLDKIALRLDREALEHMPGIVNVNTSTIGERCLKLRR